ncbi:inhibitor of nuclear factor kappa-B kinase subunit alpha isoform X2 [Neocloeon triangulifer]|nr:inhibitor of nuclear factor kappa-B kinase subunit alpha isoform X2 [Neocloeon triangulifer]
MCDEPAEIEGWLRQQVLGSGAFGVVTLWKNRETGEQIAVKKCRWVDDPALTPKHKERWTKEVEIMQRLRHPGVVKALTVPPELERELRVELPLLCMEYCSKGDLRQVLNMSENCCGLSEVEVRSIVKDIASAVGYLHSNKITHRDLKPDNIVLQEGENNQISYKLIDLGYAKELDQSSMAASFVGTLQYLAPELFLNTKYSCTVDYWSLGLLTHEIITGVRPFLPQMSPVAWMTHVQKKARDDICAFQTEDGSIVFSKELYSENHISSTFQYHMERWLRILLDWDPKRRGRQSADTELLVFTMLGSILTKKIVPVFCVPECRVLSYEVDGTTELATLQQWIARDTGLAVKDQELLFPRGTTPDPSLSADQCCLHNDGTIWFLYVLQKGRLELPQVKPNIPTLVGQMVSDIKSVFEYQFQRRSWAHAVFFLQQEASLYCNFLRAHRAKMLSVLSKTCELGKLVQRVQQEKQRLSSLKDLFTASLEFDLSKVSELKSSNLEKISGVWSESKTQLLNKIMTVDERLSQLEIEAEAIGGLALQLQRSPFARIRISSNLDSLAEAGQNCYEALKRRNKEQRKVLQNNSEMARVVYNCLKHRDKLLHDEPFSQHLKQLIECQTGTDKVTAPMESCLLEIARLQEEITKSQLQRQEDIWLSAVHGHIPPTVPSRGAFPKQAEAVQKQHSKAESPPSDPCQCKSVGVAGQNPPQDQSADVIKENQELRYLTQELMNKGYGLYRDVLGLDLDEFLNSLDKEKTTE